MITVADTYQKRTQDFYSELLKVQRKTVCFKLVSYCWLVPLINASIDLDWWSLLGWMGAKDIIWSSKKLCFNYGLRNLAQWKLNISLQYSQELYQGLKTNKHIPDWLLSVEFWKDSGIVYWSGWTWRGERLFWVMLIKRRLRFRFRSRSLEKNRLLTFHFTMSNSMWQNVKVQHVVQKHGQQMLFVTVRGKTILNPLEHLPSWIFCLFCVQILMFCY